MIFYFKRNLDIIGRCNKQLAATIQVTVALQLLIQTVADTLTVKLNIYSEVLTSQHTNMDHQEKAQMVQQPQQSMVVNMPPADVRCVMLCNLCDCLS